MFLYSGRGTVDLKRSEHLRPFNFSSLILVWSLTLYIISNKVLFSEYIWQNIFLNHVTLLLILWFNYYYYLMFRNSFVKEGRQSAYYLKQWIIWRSNTLRWVIESAKSVQLKVMKFAHFHVACQWPRLLQRNGNVGSM